MLFSSSLENPTFHTARVTSVGLRSAFSDGDFLGESLVSRVSQGGHVTTPFLEICRALGGRDGRFPAAPRPPSSANLQDEVPKARIRLRCARQKGEPRKKFRPGTQVERLTKVPKAPQLRCFHPALRVELWDSG